MKLLLTIVQDADAQKLQQALTEAGFRATKLASTGGFLRQGNTTLLVGVNDQDVITIKEIVRTTCRERTQMTPMQAPSESLPEPFLNQVTEVLVGGAVIFVLNVEAFERL